MESIKFIHCADIHFDAPFSSLGSSFSKSSIRRDDLKSVFEALVERAYKEQVDFLFISGDLYEHSYVRKSSIIFINECFRKIKNTKIVMIPGNHDPWVKGAYYRSFNWAQNVYILREDKPFIKFNIFNKDICIYSQWSKDTVPLLPSNTNILLLHGSLD